MEEKVVERDFEQEVLELYREYPALRGEELPESVARACVKGQKLSDAYRDYSQEREKDQNEKAARQAPVKSVTRGGAVDAKPEDAFLRGFNTAW